MKRNPGREYRPQGNPEEVRIHDFLINELGRAVPYGVDDLAANFGWVSVGVDHDTAAFAVNSNTVGSFDPDHDAVMRIGGEAPGGGPILSVGISAMFEYGVPPPRIVNSALG